MTSRDESEWQAENKFNKVKKVRTPEQVGL
jgi:hypothetical protein